MLVEGYDDRAFVAGYLREVVGLAAPAPGAPVVDPSGARVAGGQFGYYSLSGARFIRVVPVHGEGKLKTQARTLGEKRRGDLRAWAVFRDGDADASGARNRSAELIRELSLPGAPFEGVESVNVVWATRSSTLPAVRNQTIEKLVWCAVADAYPDRDAPVPSFLAPPPELIDVAKAHALAFIAKWYAQHGASDAYAAVWRDQLTRAGLLSVLRADGDWQAFERIVRE